MPNMLKNVNVNPVSNFEPKHTGGDQDFFGDPKVHLEVALHRRVQLLTVSFYISFSEGKGDFTEFQGQDERVVFDCDVEYPGWRLSSIVASQELTWSWDGTLVGHGEHYIRVGETGLVNNVILHGDAWGGIFGGPDHPAIRAITFNPVGIDMQQVTEQDKLQYESWKSFIAAERAKAGGRLDARQGKRNAGIGAGNGNGTSWDALRQYRPLGG